MEPELFSITWMEGYIHEGRFFGWVFVQGEGSLFVLVAKPRDAVTVWDVVRHGNNVVHGGGIHRRWDTLMRRRWTFPSPVWNPACTPSMLLCSTERSVLVHSLQPSSVCCLFERRRSQ